MYVRFGGNSVGQKPMSLLKCLYIYPISLVRRALAMSCKVQLPRQYFLVLREWLTGCGWVAWAETGETCSQTARCTASLPSNPAATNTPVTRVGPSCLGINRWCYQWHLLHLHCSLISSLLSLTY